MVRPGRGSPNYGSKIRLRPDGYVDFWAIEKGGIRLKADFNSVRDGTTIVARFDFAHAAALPDVGDLVEVRDPEGNRCLGEVIERVGDDRFRVRLDYTTWEDGPELIEVVDLMEALRRSVAEAVDARDRKIAGTGPERETYEVTVTLVNGHYDGIVKDLRAGTKNARQIVTDNAAEYDVWGTGEAKVLRLL